MRPSRDDYVLLLLLGLTWGASFLLIKLALVTIPPFTVAAGRIVIGAVALTAFARWRGVRFPRSRGAWLKLAFMGSIGTILPFVLICLAETRIDSGLAAIFMSGTPLATILMAHAFQRDEPLTAAKMVGVALGGVGILVLIGPSAAGGVGRHTLAELAMVAVTICYAANGVVARRLAGVSPIMVAVGMLLTAAVVGVPLSLAIERPWTLAPSPLSLLALLVLGLMSTAIGYLLMFRILARAGAGFASFNNFLVPIFGVFWGMLFLHERPQPWSLAGLAFVLAGLAALRLWPSRRPR
jgi:drug/metabolite transporter (DMT)-like permease